MEVKKAKSVTPKFHKKLNFKVDTIHSCHSTCSKLFVSNLGEAVVFQKGLWITEFFKRFKTQDWQTTPELTYGQQTRK